MNYLLMSGQGLGLGLALRLREEGAKVAVWIKDGRFKPSYDGLLLKIQRWEDHLDANTSVIFDSAGGGRTADRLRGRGFRVLSGGTFPDQLESDSEVHAQFINATGVKLSKGQSAAPITVETWFDGKTWAGGWVQSVVVDKAYPGNLGGQGYIASAAWLVREDDSLHEVMDKLIPGLIEQEYSGPVAVTLWATADGTLLFGKVMLRFREETLPLLLELLEGPKSSLLGNAAYKDKIAVGLVVSIPPYPRDKGTADEVVLSGLTREDRPHLYFHDIWLNKDNQLEATRGSGKLVTVTGSADSIMQAFEPVYELVNRIQVEDKQFRNDSHSELVYLKDAFEQYHPTVKVEQVDPPYVPPNTGCLYLVRHGETSYNAKGLLRGTDDPPLDEDGKKMAMQVAEFLKGKFDKIFCDGMKRTEQTADIIAYPLKPIIDDRVRCLDIGEYSGKSKKDNIEDLRQGYFNHPDIVIPGGESVNYFLSEWQVTWLSYVDRAKQGERIGLVAHGSNLTAVMHDFKPVDLISLAPEPCTVLELDLTTDKVNIVFQPEEVKA